MANKKLALLLAQADEDYQKDFIKGVLSRAFSYGYDVCVFSMFIKYQNNKEREIGDSNIYNLVNYDQFDGVILLSDTIQTPGVEKKIEQKIYERFSGPVVAVDTESEYFYSFWTDGYSAVYDSIEHLIEVHGYKDIAYLTGRKQHVHSQRRLEAYKAAMAAHGLPVNENRIFYGDFWYYSGVGCAEQLMRDKDNLPEAVACANDCMAIGLAGELSRQGIRIPEDIAIIGYGTTEEGQTSPSTITSTYIPAQYYGEYSVDSIISILHENQPVAPNPETRLFIGESCGCNDSTGVIKKHKRSTWMTKNSEDGFESVHNYLMEDMLLASSVEEYFRIVYESIFFLRGVKHLEICLDENWLDAEKLQSEMFQNEGYPRKMLNVLSYDSENAENCCVSVDKSFDTSQMCLTENNGEPKAFVFTPLFYEDKTFGYVMLSYGSEIKTYESVCRLWLTALSRGLEALRRGLVIEFLEKQNSLKNRSKYPVNEAGQGGISTRAGTMSFEEIREMEEVEKILDNNLLKYVFQPIVSAVDGEIFSYEALMRSNSGWNIPPLQIIKHADMLGRISDIEKATFVNVLNIVSENEVIFKKRKVFINSIPGSKLEYNDFVKIEEMLSKYSGTAVVELTEQAELQDEELETLKQQYRRMGIGLAVDDYGTGYSNISNLLRYMPDYVKIDRSLLSDIQNSSQKQHFVREVVDFCHSNNILALAEGVETREELATVIRLGADLIQGYYVARPSEEIINAIDSNVRMEITRFRQEREDGISNQVYVAGRNSRVSLNALTKENITTIVIGEKDVNFRDITIAGTPNSDTKIHIEVLEGYDGRLTLENVCLSNIKKRPCVIIGENCNMTLRLDGENSFSGGGVKVPESSHVIFEGDGNLKLRLTGSESYAIGNTVDSHHGIIEFYQDGEINIESKGKTTIGIGSGLGGDTKIHRGKYVIRMNGDEGVGVGSLNGDNDLVIHDCDLFMENTFYKGVCIGNLNKNTSVKIWRSLIRCNASGKKLSVIGSVDGDQASVHLHDLSVQFNIRSDYSTAVGSLSGSTRFHEDTANFIYKGMGREALVYGGFSSDVEVELENMDMSVDLASDNGLITNAPPEKVTKDLVRSRIVINGVKQ